MPIGRSAKKSLRKAVKNRRVNLAFKTKLKALIKSYLKKPTLEALQKTESLIDKASKKKIWHRNKIARVKARLARKLAAKEVKAATAKKTIKKSTAKKSRAKKTGKKMTMK